MRQLLPPQMTTTLRQLRNTKSLSRQRSRNKPKNHRLSRNLTMATQATLDTPRHARLIIGQSASAHSNAGPIREGLIIEEATRAERINDGLISGPLDGRSAAARQQSAIFFTKVRRYLFKLRKSQSPRRARASHLT